VLGHDPVAEFAHPGTEVEDHVFIAAGNELHTAGIATEGAAH